MLRQMFQRITGLSMLANNRTSLQPSRYFKTSSLYQQDDNETDEMGGEPLKINPRPTGFTVPFETAVAPQRIPVRGGYEKRQMLKKMLIKRGTNIGDYTAGEIEGTIGSDTLLSIDTAKLDRYLPTLETLKQPFDGVPFEQLPVVHIRASYNNTIIGVVDHKGTPIVYTSSSKEGYKHTKKKTPLAGQATGAAAAQKMVRRGVTTVRVMVSGLGPGRMTAVKALATGGINVVSISDKTPLPEMGPRPRKIRRV